MQPIFQLFMRWLGIFTNNSCQDSKIVKRE
jgi:hypothetical protein